MALDILNGLNVPILVTDGFEQVELTEPRKALDEAGATTKIVSPKRGQVRAWNFTDWSVEMPVDVALDTAKPEDFDALLLPGGVINPDSLRIQPKAVAFAKSFFDGGKPVAAICHGPWTVIDYRRNARPPHDLMALAQNRPQECRRRLGGSGIGRGQRPRHEPQSR
jgi:protease I